MNERLKKIRKNNSRGTQDSKVMHERLKKLEKTILEEQKSMRKEFQRDKDIEKANNYSCSRQREKCSEAKEKERER
jgi:hypothetical protein